MLTKLIFISCLFMTVLSTCSDPNTVKLCYNTYMESFELTSNPFPNYRAYKTVREMLLVEKGPAGQQTVCQYVNALIKCLGNLESECITTNQFGGYFNLSEVDSANYVQDYFMMKYTCNQGFDDAMKYFYCMEQVGLYDTEKLINCSNTEQNALTNGGGCPAYNNYITCLSDVYTNYCGPDIRLYICTLELDGITGVDPTCNGQLQDCSKPAPGSFLKLFKLKTANKKTQQAKKIHQNGLSVFP